MRGAPRLRPYVSGLLTTRTWRGRRGAQAGVARQRNTALPVRHALLGDADVLSDLPLGQAGIDSPAHQPLSEVVIAGGSLGHQHSSGSVGRIPLLLRRPHLPASVTPLAVPPCNPSSSSRSARRFRQTKRKAVSGARDRSGLTGRRVLGQGLARYSHASTQASPVRSGVGRSAGGLGR